MRTKRTRSPSPQRSAGSWIYNDRNRQMAADCKRSVSANIRANKFGVPGVLTPDDVRRILAIGVCAYCGTTEKLGIDHVIPMSSGGPNTPENIVACCVPCNSAKGRASHIGAWSNQYEACVLCGTTDYKHAGRGLCRRCYTSVRRANPSSDFQDIPSSRTLLRHAQKH